MAQEGLNQRHVESDLIIVEPSGQNDKWRHPSCWSLMT
jgi:hypothetical protein